MCARVCVYPYRVGPEVADGQAALIVERCDQPLAPRDHRNGRAPLSVRGDAARRLLYRTEAGADAARRGGGYVLYFTCRPPNWQTSRQTGAEFMPQIHSAQGPGVATQRAKQRGSGDASFSERGD